jgi:hypothetical protein
VAEINMPRSTIGAVIGLTVLGALPLSGGSVLAAPELPFLITAPPVSGYHVRCAGPFFRSSGCVPFGPGEEYSRVEIAVSRKASGGDGLRGGYEVELIPESGDVDGRTLRPAEDVEG